MNVEQRSFAPLNVDAVEASMRNSSVGHRILYLPVATSTMDVARQQAGGGAKEGTVVVAEEQISGRGRFGRHWLSASGQSLSFSVLLYPSALVSGRLSVVAPVAIMRAIRRVTGLSPTLKWPNDVRLSEKKVCGILIETAFENSRVTSAIVGVGINVNSNPAEHPEADFTATCLAAELGKPVSREDLLKAALIELGLAYGHPQAWNEVREEWESSLDTLGRQIQVRWRDNVEEGLAEAVDDEGSLLLRRADGDLITLAAGEVTLQV